MPPPPSRPLSAPQSAQPSAFSPPPLQPQMTGYPTPQVAPLGQSLNDLTQARLQQQYTQAMQQQQQPMMPMMTGMPQQQAMMPMMTGMPQGMPLPMQVPQQTGFMGGGFPQQQQQQPASGGFMPQPTGTGMQPPMQIAQPTGFNMGYPQQQQQQQQMPPQQMPPQPTGFGGGALAPPMQPLVPQKTGPPPPVRFGVPEGQKKIVPQATGRRANLAAASEFSPSFHFESRGFRVMGEVERVKCDC